MNTDKQRAEALVTFLDERHVTWGPFHREEVVDAVVRHMDDEGKLVTLPRSFVSLMITRLSEAQTAHHWPHDCRGLEGVSDIIAALRDSLGERP